MANIIGSRMRQRVINSLVQAGLVALALSLAFAAPVAAGPLDDASAAYDHGDYEIAIRLFRPLAEQGDARAQLGLGFAYARGDGVPQDHAEAVKWFGKAADQGLDGAQFLLGMAYEDGAGVPQDRAEAAKWFRMAADQGNADAQFNLGNLYATGRGVPQDYVQAHLWLNLAASGYSASETERRDTAINDRNIVAAKMTPAQIAEAQNLLREWKPTKQLHR